MTFKNYYLFRILQLRKLSSKLTRKSSIRLCQNLPPHWYKYLAKHKQFNKCTINYRTQQFTPFGKHSRKHYQTNMKSYIFLALFACILACVWACDPDSNNEPTCTSDNLNTPIRNFWDPTAYWMCKSAGAKAELVRCDTELLFDSAQGKCIFYSDWTWTYPCPEN
ncbi:uncharacterized protein LOC142228374 [Haematobia irritans]|uniref:uncharacterized protein LOC142228374 n=1 Tax=Haematobia irritans TaxID=7368 RepID=UPI003F508A47